MTLSPANTAPPLPLWRTAIIVFIVVSSISSFAFAVEDNNGVDRYKYPPNQHLMFDFNLLQKGRFHPAKTKKGAKCDVFTGYKTCPGIVQVKNGLEFLFCCNSRCADLITDENNCGACGNLCGFGQQCCTGYCTAVSYDIMNCGRCGVSCKPGTMCEFGVCGYA